MGNQIWVRTPQNREETPYQKPYRAEGKSGLPNLNTETSTNRAYSPYPDRKTKKGAVKPLPFDVRLNREF